MGKHSKEVKAPRRHALADKAPVLAAIIIAATGWFASMIIGSWVNAAIMRATPSYPEHGLAGYIVGAALIMLIYRWWFRPEFQGQCIGGKPGKGLLLGLIFIAYFAISMFIPTNGQPTQFHMPSFSMISLAVAAGVGEELCFRGLLLGTLMRKWKDDHRKMMLAVILSSATFGAIHISNISAGAGVFVSVMQAVSSFFIGVAFAAVYIRSGNLLVPMIYHTAVDIMAFGTNPAVDTQGVVTGTYQMTDAIDDGLCFILMLIGLWMLRSGVFEEIREIWDQKWREIVE